MTATRSPAPAASAVGLKASRAIAVEKQSEEPDSATRFEQPLVVSRIANSNEASFAPRWDQITKRFAFATSIQREMQRFLKTRE